MVCNLLYFFFLKQLVIEPLRALIDSQVKELCGKGVNVETLLTLSDAKIQGRQHAALRLNELAQQNYPMQTILFSTPEMICGCLDGLRSLVTRRLLSLIVIDEFDCIDESNDVYRKTYTELVPKLKAITRSTSLPFLFLSATASTALIEDLRGGLDTGLPANLQSTTLPKLFLSSQALPPKHAYSGEFVVF